MLNHRDKDDPGVNFGFPFTPGKIYEYGVAQNYREVFATCQALCTELAAVGDGDMLNVPVCVKNMRVKSFSHGLRRFAGLGNHTSMQRFFESESVRTEKDGGVVHSKKYRGYLRGEHMPGARTLEIINRLTGRDWNVELNQTLWLSLDTTMTLEAPMELLDSLPHWWAQEYGKAMYQSMLHDEHDDFVRYGHRMLESSGLPPLTALILLLRTAHKIQKQRAAFTLAGFLACKLMILGAELQQQGIASLMYRFAIQHLFPLAQQWQVNMSACELARKSMLLNLLPFCSHTKLSTQRFEQGEREGIMCLWLQSTKGYMALDALSLKLLKVDGNFNLVAEGQAHRVALKNLASIVSAKTRRSPLVLSRDYLCPDLRFKVLGSHRSKELKKLLSQLAST